MRITGDSPPLAPSTTGIEWVADGEMSANDDVETLLDRASQALLAAKGDGRNRIRA